LTGAVAKGKNIMKPVVWAAAATVIASLASAAAASPCDVAQSGLLILEYDTGVSALSRDQKAKLDAFADIAKHRNAVCVRAQVDAQGSAEANRRVSAARGEAVRAYLASKGVRPNVMEIRVQEEAFRPLGLLGADKQSERRVSVTYQ
jgi:outer membrane protein OmpA-like peptidoglycan-associated protein